MRVYGQADFVVGLDVDKDDYDKFSVSFGCAMLSWVGTFRSWHVLRAYACG